MGGERKGGEGKRKKRSVLSIFMQADGVDMLLMALRFIGAVCDGFTAPIVVLVMEFSDNVLHIWLPAGILYNEAGTTAEEAISFTRTVYSFVGETKTINEFSSALESIVNLGPGAWRLVMYHGAQGGTVYAVGAAIAIGDWRPLALFWFFLSLHNSTLQTNKMVSEPSHQTSI
ncbi:hypothetical protein Pint_19368 [Pistacia integerrima]|uniref:Uncharacterized protein n=1 Tax=Pistacia integerrima TaxID=434235 RepID=A0ACC0YVH4_9ROSI|nr:hypothetical protein Pint_19368 [Pistacia integerrima]